MTLLNVLLVGVGGGLGAMARYWVGTWAQPSAPGTAFPYATLLVNVVGRLVIGGLAYQGEVRGALTPEARLLLMTGFLGGFTTFSAFGNETMGLLRGGAAGTALAYVGAHLVLGLGAVWVGWALAQRLWS